MEQEWVEDESHVTIDGVRWVAREAGGCMRNPAPKCEAQSDFGGCGCDKVHCGRTLRHDHLDVRWYRADSPALAYFDKPKEEPKVTEKQPTTTVSAPTLCETAADLMRERAKTYDVGGTMEGERSMAKTIAAFNHIAGRDLSEGEGWLLMAVLKMVRDRTNGPHKDSIEDLVAYAALYGEARLGGK